MIFAAPVPFQQAIASAAVRTVLRTELSSAGMRELLKRLPADLRRRFVFLSRVSNYEIVDRVHAIIGQLGQVNVAKGRELVRDLLETVNYQPAPGTEGTIQDLWTRKRIDLALKTNLAQTNGLGHFIQRQNPDVLTAFPALELRRDYQRRLPRGSEVYQGDAGIGWETRWKIAAQTARDVAAARVLEQTGRLVALADSEIWEVLGTEWEDSLGNAYDPLAWGTGMRQHPVGRAEAIELGLMGDKDQVKPQPLPDLNAAVEKPVEIRDAEMFAALRRSIDADPDLKEFAEFGPDNVIRLKPEVSK